MIKVLLVGDVLDGEVVELPDGDHQARKFDVVGGKGKVKEVVYRISPIVGQEQTWHIGRANGVGFDEAISHVLKCYHITSARREFDDRFASHERESEPEFGGTGI